MAAAVYRNFTVRAGLTSATELRVQIAGPVPSGIPARDEFELVPYGPALFQQTISGREVELLKAVKRRPVPQEQLVALGRVLANLILPGRVRQRFVDSLTQVRSAQQRLRLRLLLESPELKPLPWEYLYLDVAPGAPPDWSGFLALDGDVSIVRHENIDAPEPQTPRGESYRMVAALASPRGQDPLNLAADEAAMKQAIARSQSIGRIEAAWAYPATLRSLQDSLRQKCDIFHFSGHGLFFGGKGQLLLEQETDHTSDPYDAGKLSNLLRDAQVKIAILGACESAGRSSDNAFGGVAASLVLSGRAAVVASQFRLLDKNALVVTEQIYRSLLSGDAIDEGVYAARRGIFQQSGLEDRDWGALVLYLRVEDGVVFPIAAGQEQPIGPRIGPTPLQTPLVGRDDELAQLRQKLEPGKNLFFYGSYGVGKTSLAIDLFAHAARDPRLAGGYIWGRLPAATPETAVEWVASNFPGQQVSRFTTLPEKVGALRQLLASSQAALIALDDVQKVGVARAILDASGACAVLMNGDRRLDLGGAAQEIELAPLAPAAAEALFMSLANLAPAQLKPAQRLLVTRICERMRRLPLGIRLAALKCAEGESLETLWSRLESAGLTVETEDIRMLLETTYEELKEAPVAQQLLVRIAAFPANEAPLDPLRADADDTEFFQAKDKLVALGLVSAAGPDRLAQHPLLGPMSLKKAPRAMVQREKQRVAEWLARYAKENRRDPVALRREHDNLFGLLDIQAKARKWNDVIGLMRDLFDYARLRGLWQDASDRLDDCLKQSHELSDANRGWARLHRAIIRTLTSRYKDALDDLDRAGERFSSDGDDTNFGRMLYRRGIVSLTTGYLSAAERDFTDALKYMSLPEATSDVIGARVRLGAVLAQQGFGDRALQEFQKALLLAHSQDEVEEETRVHIAMGSLFDLRGDRTSAEKHLQEALTLATRIDDTMQAAQIIRDLGDQHYRSGRYDKARAAFDEAMRKFGALGYQPGVSRCQHALGNVALAETDYNAAEELYRKALASSESLGLRGPAAYTRFQLAVLAHRRSLGAEGLRAASLRAEARGGYDRALEDAKAMTDRVLEGAALAQLSKLSREEGDNTAARKHAQDALKLAQQIGDSVTRAVALYNIGLVDAAEGKFANAKSVLAEAQAAFAAFEGINAIAAEQASRSVDEHATWSQRDTPHVDRTLSKDIYTNVDRTLGGGLDNIAHKTGSGGSGLY